MTVSMCVAAMILAWKTGGERVLCSMGEQMHWHEPFDHAHTTALKTLDKYFGHDDKCLVRLRFDASILVLTIKGVPVEYKFDQFGNQYSMRRTNTVDDDWDSPLPPIARNIVATLDAISDILGVMDPDH